MSFLDMLCVVVGCSNRSDCDEGISFYRIPAVYDKEGEEGYELRMRWRDRFLAAMSRKDIDVHALHKYRICEKYFMSGKPASLYDQTNPDWLPTLNLGYERMTSSESCSRTAVVRWERASERDQRRAVQQEIEELLPTVTANEMDRIVAEEVMLIAAEQIETAKQYLKPREATFCEWSGEVKNLEELAKSQNTIKVLTEQLTTQSYKVLLQKNVCQKQVMIL